jgi:hypothetical protein
MMEGSGDGVAIEKSTTHTNAFTAQHTEHQTIRNPNIEYRNPKQIQMTKIQMI